MLLKIVGLLNEDLRFVYLSNNVPGRTTEEFLGTHPWDNVYPEKQEESRNHYETVMETKEDREFSFDWEDPKTKEDYFFWCSLRYVGAPGAAILQHAWTFGLGLPTLTEREREILLRLGEGCGPVFVAQELGSSLSTVQTHVARIKKKLDLSDHEELIAFGSLYRHAMGTS